MSPCLMLLGQLAAVSGDRTTFGDAKAFLRLLKLDVWERKLDQDAQSGSLAFYEPEFFSKLIERPTSLAQRQ